MGIISTLLTGGTIVGRVCQALSSALSTSVNLSNGCSIVDSQLVVGGGRFIKSDDNNEHVMKTYLFNPTAEYMTLSMPNVGGIGAIEYVVKPTEKLPIDDCLKGNVEPDAEILVGPVSGGAKTIGNENDILDAAIKLIINDLKIGGGEVSVGGFRINATPSGLLIVSGAITIVSVVYFYARSNHRVEARTTQEIPADLQNSTVDGSKSYRVDIDFEALGFGDDETFEEMSIFMSTGSDAIGATDRISKSEPLTEAEMEYFKANNLLIL